MGRTKDFMQHYGDTHGLFLPGRTPGFRKNGVILTSSCETKVKIYNACRDACSQEGLYYYGNNNSLSIKLHSMNICIIKMCCIIFLGVKSMSETTFRET